MSFDNNFYICKTCNASVINNWLLDIILDEIKCLNRLEVLLIFKMLLFTKIFIMPNGQSKKLQGPVVNIPIDLNKTFS